MSWLSKTEYYVEEAIACHSINVFKRFHPKTKQNKNCVDLLQMSLVTDIFEMNALKKTLRLIWKIMQNTHTQNANLSIQLKMNWCIELMSIFHNIWWNDNMPKTQNLGKRKKNNKPFEFRMELGYIIRWCILQNK